MTLSTKNLLLAQLASKRRHNYKPRIKKEAPIIELPSGYKWNLPPKKEKVIDWDKVKRAAMR